MKADKTFPLRIDNSFHKQLQDAAYLERKSIHQYILDTIKDKMKKEVKK